MLAGTGIYGVLVYLTGMKRVPEIGIRMALEQAEQCHLVGAAAKPGMILAGVAVGMAGPAAGRACTNWSKACSRPGPRLSLTIEALISLQRGYFLLAAREPWTW